MKLDAAFCVLFFVGPCWSCWSGDTSSKASSGLILADINDYQEGEDTYDFGVCPFSNRYAFNSGQKCCSQATEWSATSCGGEAIDCNSASCEDRFSCCVPRTNGDCYSRETFEIRNLSPNYDGKYQTTLRFEANRPIYNGVDEREDECMWWHQPTRHWWIGQCEDIGEPSGYAYIDKDLECPNSCILEEKDGELSCSEQLPTWRKGESDEVINGATLLMDRNVYLYPSSTAAEKTVETTSLAGVNSIVQYGTRFRQRCTFKRRNGVYVCLKKNQ